MDRNSSDGVWLDWLERERKELKDQLERLTVPAVDQMTYGNQAEAASEVFEQQRALSLRQHFERRLQEVEKAIRLAAAGQHGICEFCGAPIPAERLEIVPETRLCVACQRGRERRR